MRSPARPEPWIRHSLGCSPPSERTGKRRSPDSCPTTSASSMEWPVRLMHGPSFDNPEDAVVPGRGLASAVPIARGHVERSVRARDDVAKPAVDAREELFGLGHLARVRRVQPDANEPLAAQGREEEVS